MVLGKGRDYHALSFQQKVDIIRSEVTRRKVILKIIRYLVCPSEIARQEGYFFFNRNHKACLAFIL